MTSPSLAEWTPAAPTRGTDVKRALRRPAGIAPVHHFTVDVEEYFQVAAFERHVPRWSWHRWPSRVTRPVERLLELLARAESRATFFVLGWVAEHHPALVRQIHDAGHEVASHGWGHRRVPHLGPSRFRESVRRSRELLEDITGHAVVGYRAPSFSITRGHEWALDILLSEGFRYDSSLFPITRPGYGYGGSRRDPHFLARPNGTLAEFPPTTVRRLGVNVPAAGGAYFRLFPYRLIRTAFRECERRGVPGTFYIHPWELDPEQPRIRVPPLTRLRHYGGIAETETRLGRLLADFRFRTIRDTLEGE